MSEQSGLWRKLTLFLPLLLLGALALVAWRSGVLDRFDSPERVAEAARSLRETPLGVAYVMLGFALGTMLFVPITALIAGTLLAFEPARGALYALLGVLLAATTTYWCGRALGARAFDYVSGPRIARFRDQLRARAFRTSILARMLPVGNFTLINWLIGGMKVPFRAFFFGNAVGAAPGIIVFALFAERITALARSPSPGQVAALIGVVVAVIALGYAAHRATRATAK